MPLQAIAHSSHMSSKSKTVGFKKRVRAKDGKIIEKGSNYSKKKEFIKSPLKVKIGYILTILICIILITGTHGFSNERTSRHIPETPPSITNGTVFFAPLAVPDNPFSLLFSAEINVIWDRSDIFLVIADEEKKEQCNNLPLLEKISSTDITCKSEDFGYEAIAVNNSTGLEWTVDNGDYFFGIGTLGESVSNQSGLSLAVSIELGLSFTGYLFFLPLGFFSYRLTRYEHRTKYF